VECAPEYYVHGSAGEDSLYCGIRSLPCKTFAYAVSLAEKEDGPVKVLYDLNANYTFTTAFDFGDKTFTISGIEEVINGVEVYPSILYSYATVYLFQIQGNTNAEVNNFVVYVDGTNSESGRYLIYVSGTAAACYVKYEYVLFLSLEFFFFFFLFFVYRNISFLTLGYEIRTPLFFFSGNGGNKFINCTFTEFLFNFQNALAGMFYFNGSSFANLSECVIANIRNNCSYSALFSSSSLSYSADSVFNITNSIICNISRIFNTESGQSTKGLLGYVDFNKFISVNNSFSNCSSTCTSTCDSSLWRINYGLIYVDSNNQIFSITKTNFSSVSGIYSGGVLYTNSTVNYTLDSCVFALCNALLGGAIYINSTGVFSLVNCLFINNTGGNGNDIAFAST
jgi:hypothetical protein